MNLERLRSILSKISYRDWQFEALLVSEVYVGEGFFLRASFVEFDVETNRSEIQKGRKWFISTHATESEVVQTALLAVLVADRARSTRIVSIQRDTSVWAASECPRPGPRDAIGSCRKRPQTTSIGENRVTKANQADQNSLGHSATCKVCNREFPLLVVDGIDGGLTCASCLEKILRQQEHDEEYCDICGVLLDEYDDDLCEQCELDDF